MSAVAALLREATTAQNQIFLMRRAAGHHCLGPNRFGA